MPTASAATEVRGQLRTLLDGLDALTADFTPDERAAIHRYLQAATEAYHRFATDDAATPGRTPWRAASRGVVTPPDARP